MTPPPTSPDPEQRPDATMGLSERHLGELELLLAGAFAPLTTYPDQAALASIRAHGTLPDGTPWPLPLTLPVPDGTGVGEVLDLTDPEGAPVARLRVESAWDEDGGHLVTGPVRPLRPVDYGIFRSLRRTPAQARSDLGSGPVLAHVASEPLLRPQVQALRERAEQTGARVLILVAIGETRGAVSGPDLVHAIVAAAPDLPPDTLVVPIPLSTTDGEQVCAHVAANYGASELAGAFSVAGGPVPVIDLPKGEPAAVLDRLDAGAELPADQVTPAVAAVLRRARPPRDRRGLVVFFTGLSGSGKSTVARALHDRILESGERTVTLLDGDVVRRLLSAGLGFSRADRDLNIRRIGFVAAEIARAGGIAICAPIAPYAATRAEVRRRVAEAGDFLLVHVATPLEVCEARDRKGLYAKARAGIIPEFTGISDPYEEPDDADLRLDTSTMSESDSVATVLDLLIGRGYLHDPSRPDPC